MTEIWKPVKGYEDRYEVSSLGNVKSISGEKITWKKQFYAPDKYYWYVILTNTEGKKSYVAVHKLVALAFVPNIHNYKFVGYIDANVENITSTNLKWWGQIKKDNCAESDTAVDDSNVVSKVISLNKDINNTIDTTDNSVDGITIDNFFDNIKKNVVNCDDDSLRLMIGKLINVLDREKLLKIFNWLWDKQDINVQTSISNELKSNHSDKITLIYKDIINKKFKLREDFSSVEIDNVLTFYSKNVSCETIAIIYNCSVDTITEILNK
jgi:hypothetical protein